MSQTKTQLVEGLNINTSAPADALAVDNSGRIGVGTSSPSHNLDISPATGAAEVKISGAEGEEASIRLYADQGDDAADIKRLLTDTSGNFKIQHYAGASFVDSLVIDSTGRVGIGTSSPDVQLSLTGSTNGVSASLRLDNTGGGGRNYLITSRDDGSLRITDDDAAAERLRIDSSGRLGLGTINPSQLLTVASTSLGAQRLQRTGLADGNGSDATLLEFANGTGAVAELRCGGDGDLQINTRSLSTNSYNNSLFVQGSGGRVGIGTTSPSFRLHSYDTAAAQGFFNGWSSGGTYDAAGAIRFGNQTTYQGRIDFDPTGNTNFIFENTYGNGSISWKINSTERMRVGGDNTQFSHNSSGDVKLYLGSSGSRIHENQGTGHITFYTNSTGRVRINYGGGFLPVTDNSMPLGGSSQRWTAVYAVNGTIQTSDAREKTDISTATLGSDFIKQLRPVSYKWNVGENIVTKDEDGETDVVTPRPGERTHWGFIAQEVKQAVDAAGVDFGGWILTDKDDPDSTQGLRYDQFIAPLTKALQEALTKIETLETANASQAATIAALDARLTALEGAG